MMPARIIYSEKFLGYQEPGHPESPARIRAIEVFLRKKGFSAFIPPEPCGENDLLLVHSADLIEKVRNNEFYDPDTPNICDIYEHAVLSCGAAIQAAGFAVGGELAVSLGRPPGHHAGRNTVGGFCYFNNMAVSVKKVIRDQHARVAVLDIDGHHGNGTEELLSGDNQAVYVSLHQCPAFPGTGSVSFGNCYNFPLLPGTDAARYMESFYKALEIISDFAPDVLGISAGFDAHMYDPLLSLELKDTHYYMMGKAIREVSGRVFVVLEGGYNKETLGNTFYCFLNGLSGVKGKSVGG